MEREAWALLVHDRANSFDAFEPTLRRAGMKTRHAFSRAEAQKSLLQADLPSVVVTDTRLADGTWTDVLSSARQVGISVPVIVVSRLVDIPLYLETIDRGAADFVVLPLPADDLAYIVRTAVLRSADSPSAAQRFATA